MQHSASGCTDSGAFVSFVGAPVRVAPASDGHDDGYDDVILGGGRFALMGPKGLYRMAFVVSEGSPGDWGRPQPRGHVVGALSMNVPTQQTQQSRRGWAAPVPAGKRT